MQYPRLAEYFNTAYSLNGEGLEELLSSFQLKEYAIGSCLLQEKEYERTLRFLNEGVVREYYSTTEKEVNINFYTQPQFISDFHAFMWDKPSRKNLLALSPVKVLEIGNNKLFSLLEKHQHDKRFIRRCFHRVLDERETFEFNRLSKTPEDLYQDLQLYRPDWLQLIPQYHIAAFLRVTPETLSRIRKRIS